MKLLCYVCIIFTFTITLHLILQNLYSEIFWKQCSDKTGKKFIFFLANNPRYLWLMVRMDEKWTKYAQHVRMRAFFYSLDLCTIFADAKKCQQYTFHILFQSYLSSNIQKDFIYQLLMNPVLIKTTANLYEGCLHSKLYKFIYAKILVDFDQYRST